MVSKRIMFTPILIIASLSNLFNAKALTEKIEEETLIISPKKTKANKNLTSSFKPIGISNILSAKKINNPPTSKKNDETKRFPNNTELKYVLTCLISLFSKLMVIKREDIEFNAVVKMPAYITKLLESG